MGKSRTKNRSEIEFLRGKIRKLESQLKYYKKREHFFESATEEINEEVHEIEADQCPRCRRGVFTTYDFRFATLSRCSNCEYEERKKKNNKKGHEEAD